VSSVASIGEKRKCTRTAADIEFEYTMTVLEDRNLRRITSEATAVDRCEKGMGFLTGFRLEPGHILRMNVPAASPQPFMVKWVRELSGKFRVGGIFL
jgi:hypothetical protein